WSPSSRMPPPRRSPRCARLWRRWAESLTTPLALAVTAVLLAGPVPALLARWKRLHLTPISSLLLWQAIALAAVLAALGAGLSLVTAFTWDRDHSVVELVVATGAALLTVMVLARLLVSGHRVGTSLRTER